ncbi:MAG TPA: MscL family protein [Solirubrobacteraceae bacterium]|nr:MscL family protein [Solirubrobacteraceae bacterium]
MSAPSTPTPAPTGNLTNDFRKFLLRGNVVDLAVGIVIGAAFGRIVSSIVAGLVTPIIAAIGGKPNFAVLSFTINGSHFHYGLVVNRSSRSSSWPPPCSSSWYGRSTRSWPASAPSPTSAAPTARARNA